MSKLYIAYGSNLNLKQMALRCPTATIYTTGMLIDWTLSFKSMGGSAYATIEPLVGSRIPVVVWKIDKASEYSLDLYEGYPTFYHKSFVDVLLNDSETIKGMAYIMNEKAVFGIPSKSYISTIEQGYIDNGLDLKYLSKFINNI